MDLLISLAYNNKYFKEKLTSKQVNKIKELISTTYERYLKNDEPHVYSRIGHYSVHTSFNSNIIVSNDVQYLHHNNIINICFEEDVIEVCFTTAQAQTLLRRKKINQIFKDTNDID